MKALKEKMESVFTALINKYGMSYEGTTLDADVYKITKDTGGYTVLFNDEGMTYLLAGYVAGNIYDEMMAEVEKTGYTIEDADGSSIFLVKI